MGASSTCIGKHYMYFIIRVKIYVSDMSFLGREELSSFIRKCVLIYVIYVYVHHLCTPRKSMLAHQN